MTLPEALAEITRLQDQLRIAQFEASGQHRLARIAEVAIRATSDIDPQYAESDHWAERRLGLLADTIRTTTQE